MCGIVHGNSETGGVKGRPVIASLVVGSLSLAASVILGLDGPRVPSRGAHHVNVLRFSKVNFQDRAFMGQNSVTIKGGMNLEHEVSVIEVYSVALSGSKSR